MEKKEIVGSRVKTGVYLGFSLAFVAASIFLPSDGDSRLWWAGVFFSICALVFGWLVIRPHRLTLDREGFALSGGLLPYARKVRWQDVSGFFVVHVRFGTTMIGFNYDLGAAPRGVAIARGISGAEGALHGVWPLSNLRMVEALNAYRNRALSTADSEGSARDPA